MEPHLTAWNPTSLLRQAASGFGHNATYLAAQTAVADLLMLAQADLLVTVHLGSTCVQAAVLIMILMMILIRS